MKWFSDNAAEKSLSLLKLDTNLKWGGIKMFKSIVKLSIFVVLISCSAWAQIINVPGNGDSPVTIQQAINACSDGGTVVIAEGTYTGPGNRNIMIVNKAVTVTSTDPTNPDVVARTVIDCENRGRAFAFIGEMEQTVVRGLTIIKGGGNFSGIAYGGAMSFSLGANPVISNCVITDCAASIGGALAVENGDSSPTIRNCQIMANTATIGGGALYFNGGNALLANCIISGNIAPRGGAVYNSNPGKPVLSHCTITDNIAQSTNGTVTVGGAVFCFNTGSLELYGCILWNNVATTGAQIQVGGYGFPATVKATYCDIQGLTAYAEVEAEVEKPEENIDVYALGANVSTFEYDGTNIDENPMFLSDTAFDAETDTFECGDFSLMEDSPCVNVGNMGYVAEEMEKDVYNKQRVFEDVIDIGAAEFVIEETNTKIRLRPRVINYRGKQNFFSCTIKIEGCDPEKIDVDSVRLRYGEGEGIAPISSRTHKRVEELMVRFDMGEVRGMLENVDLKTVTLHVAGVLDDLTEFEGSDKLKIYQKKDKGEHKGHDKDEEKGEGKRNNDDNKGKKGK